MGLIPAGAVALLLNVLLFVSAAQLSREHAFTPELPDAVPVSLITLEPPETPAPETPREVPPPRPRPQLDFEPQLSPPALDGPGPLDIQITLDPSLFAGAPRPADFIFDMGDLDSPPRAVVRHRPDYPFRAQQRNIEGSVRVKLLVQADGSVTRVEILSSEPAGVFDDAVRRSVPTWRFEPGRIDGEAVASWVVTDVRFELGP